MKNKNLQTFICAIGESGAKHYLALGTTKLQKQDLKSFFSGAPTPAILKALDGMKPARLIWVDMERVSEGCFSVCGWVCSKNGIRYLDACRINGRDFRIGEMADIITDEIRREL